MGRHGETEPGPLTPAGFSTPLSLCEGEAGTRILFRGGGWLTHISPEMSCQLKAKARGSIWTADVLDGGHVDGIVSCYSDGPLLISLHSPISLAQVETDSNTGISSGYRNQIPGGEGCIKSHIHNQQPVPRLCTHALLTGRGVLCTDSTRDQSEQHPVTPPTDSQ
ncbi:hypothetical protein P4O66_006177, partial [Electrophorus voltai]